MLGYAFMGKAHANAYRTLSYMTWPPPLRPELVLISGRNRQAVQEAASRYGFDEALTDWARAGGDGRVAAVRQLGPERAARASRRSPPRRPASTCCARSRWAATPTRAHEIWRRVAAAGVVHMCGFNYRFVPAVRLAREMIAGGSSGEIRHFRARYLQSWGVDAELMTWRSIARRRARARSAISARTSSTWPATWSARWPPSAA